MTNTVRAASDRYWYSRGQYITPLQDSFYRRTLASEAFEAGARWSLHETSKLSPHIAQFLEMCVLLGLLDHATLERSASATEEGDSGSH